MNKSAEASSSSKNASSSSVNKNKTSKTGPINKSLLTPCRRVGLSRKKTPQSNNKSSQIVSKGKEQETEPQKLQERISVPSVLKKVPEKDVKARLEKVQKPYKVNKPKPDKKRAKVEDRELKENFKDTTESKIKSPAKKTAPNKVQVQPKPGKIIPKEVAPVPVKSSPPKPLTSANELSSTDKSNAFVQRQPTADSISSILNENTQSTQQSTISTQSSKRSRRNLLATKHNSQDTLTDKSDSEDDLCILSNLKKLKHASTSSANDAKMEISSSNCIVQLERMSQDEQSQVEVTKRSSKRKARAIVIESSDEDDFVASQKSAKSNKSTSSQSQSSTPKATGIQEKKNAPTEVIYIENENGNVENRIATLKFDIQIKQQKIAELERSEIYKKKHNLEELKILTKQWKVGCQEALNDLLPLIKENTGNEIDMATLLTQMKIPYNFIGFNVEDNCFL